MNKYDITVISKFLAPSNYKFLRAELMSKFSGYNNATYIHNFINGNMQSFMDNFIEYAKKTLMYKRQYTNDISGETTEQSLVERVMQLNLAFISDRVRFIEDYFVCYEPIRQTYGNTDKFAASARSIVYTAPRNTLRDNNTSVVENSREIYGCSVVDNLVGENRIRGNGSIGGDVDETHIYKPMVSKQHDNFYKRLNDGRSVQYRRETDGIGDSKSAADAILESWRYPSHGATTRDDLIGDYGTGNMFSGDLHSGRPMASRQKTNCPRVQYGGEYFQGSGANNIENGLVADIFDNTGDIPIGTYNHQDLLFNDPYIRALNDGGQFNEHAETFCTKPLGNANKFWASGSSFVDETDPAALSRMLRARTFKTYPRGANKPLDTYASINAIWTGELLNDQTPWYEKSLYNRYHDRDVDESIGGFERGCINYAYDMSSLYNRTASKPFVFRT